MATTIALIAAAAVAAVAAGASAYMASENAAKQAKAARMQADWQAKAEEKQAEAARKQARMKAQRMLNAQGSKAGGAGVVAGEGSLLIDQLDAASTAQYEEDLAAYGHELSSQANRYESKLFKWKQGQIESQAGINIGLAMASSAASSYSSYRGGSVATGAVTANKTGAGPAQDY